MDRMRGFSDSLSVDASQLPLQDRIQTHPVNPVHPVFCLSRLHARLAPAGRSVVLTQHRFNRFMRFHEDFNHLANRAVATGRDDGLIELLLLL